MRLFRVDGQTGRWPVGYAQIVVAFDRQEAEMLARRDIERIGLRVDDAMELVELPLDSSASYILNSGDY